MGKFYSLLLFKIFSASFRAQLLQTAQVVFRNANLVFTVGHLKAEAISLHISFNWMHHFVKQLKRVEIKGFHSATNRVDLFYFPSLRLTPQATVIRECATHGKVGAELRSFWQELDFHPKIIDSYCSISPIQHIDIECKGLNVL